jgi:hypothetical protein
LGNQLRRNLGVLLAIGHQAIRQVAWIGLSQGTETIDPELHQHVAPLGADPTDFAEVSLRRGHLVTAGLPTAEHALLAIGHQGRRRGPAQIIGQALQRFIQLSRQAAGQGDGLLLQPPA